MIELPQAPRPDAERIGTGAARLFVLLVAAAISACSVAAWAGGSTAGRTGLGTQLCYAAVGDSNGEGLLEVCIDVAPEIMSAGFHFSGALTLCQGFAQSPERRLACYSALNKASAHDGFKRDYYACVDRSLDLALDEQVRCIEQAIEAVQIEMQREVNKPFAATLCSNVRETKLERASCLERVDSLLGTSNAVELGLDICRQASTPARAIDCYQYTFRQYRDNKSMKTKLRGCNRAYEPKGTALAACLQDELQTVLAAYRANKKKRETMIVEALSISD